MAQEQCAYPRHWLLEDTDFKRKLQAAVEADLASKIPGFADLPVAERLALRNAEIFRITANKDITGARLAYDPSNLSLWDIASKNFVEQATGDFRVVASGVSDTSVLMQAEMPALLARSGNPMIDGIELDHIRRLGAEAGTNAILAEAHAQTFLSHLSSSNLDRYRSFTPNDVVEQLSLVDNLGAFSTWLNEALPEQQARFRAGVQAMQEAAIAASNNGVARGLNRIGISPATPATTPSTARPAPTPWPVARATTSTRWTTRATR